MHELIFEAGDNWSNLPTFLKRGKCIFKREIEYYVNNSYYTGSVKRKKWVIDEEIPIFNKELDYILCNL